MGIARVKPMPEMNI